jgi:hypothetical protein
MPISKITTEDRHFLKAVLAPTWLSSLVIVLAALIVTAGTMITFGLNHSAFKQDLLGWEQSHTDSLSITGQSTESVNPTIENSWPLILVWAGVGLLTYTVASSIVRFILEAIEFRRELDYVHANRKSMMAVTVEHLIMRLVSAILLLVLVLLFVYHVLPYAISTAQASAGHVLTVAGIRGAVLSFIFTMLCVYFASVLMRMSIGRTRVFSHSSI